MKPNSCLIVNQARVVGGGGSRYKCAADDAIVVVVASGAPQFSLGSHSAQHHAGEGRSPGQCSILGSYRGKWGGRVCVCACEKKRVKSKQECGSLCPCTC